MLSLFASRPDTVINPQWLELPMSQTVFHGPKDVRAIEVRLYTVYHYCFSDCALKEPAPQALDDETAGKLWTLSEEMVGMKS